MTTSGGNLPACKVLKTQKMRAESRFFANWSRKPAERAPRSGTLSARIPCHLSVGAGRRHPVESCKLQKKAPKALKSLDAGLKSAPVLVGTRRASSLRRA